jgi:hypothetical protein
MVFLIKALAMKPRRLNLILTGPDQERAWGERRRIGLSMDYTNERRFGSRVRGSILVFCALASSSSFLVHTIMHVSVEATLQICNNLSKSTSPLAPKN